MTSSAIESGKYDHITATLVVTTALVVFATEILGAQLRLQGDLPDDLRRVTARSTAIMKLWEGLLYVFDKRMHMEFTPDTVTIGKATVRRSI